MVAPDGKLIANVSDGGLSTQPKVIHVLDLASGEIETVTDLPDVMYPSAHSYSWSPDGRFWAMGGTIMEVAPPYRSWPVKGDYRSPVFWSPDGTWFVVSDDPEVGYEISGGGWGEIFLYRVDDSGPVLWQSLGGGFPCGWDSSGRLYIIRWAAWEDRLDWGGGGPERR